MIDKSLPWQLSFRKKTYSQQRHSKSKYGPQKTRLASKTQLLYKQGHDLFLPVSWPTALRSEKWIKVKSNLLSKINMHGLWTIYTKSIEIYISLTMTEFELKSHCIYFVTFNQYIILNKFQNLSGVISISMPVQIIGVQLTPNSWVKAAWGIPFTANQGRTTLLWLKKVREWDPAQSDSHSDCVLDKLPLLSDRLSTSNSALLKPYWDVFADLVLSIWGTLWAFYNLVTWPPKVTIKLSYLHRYQAYLCKSVAFLSMAWLLQVSFVACLAEPFNIQGPLFTFNFSYFSSLGI